MKKTADEVSSLVRSVPPIITSMLIVSVIGMNLLANKSIDTGVEWLALDGGILLSWMTFLALDVIVHCYGPKAGNIMSLVAIAFNLFMALVFFTASRIPGVWGESFVEGSEAVINTALDNTFAGTWFILLGSSIAFAVSSLVNNTLNYLIGQSLKRKGTFAVFAARSYISTFIAQFVDNIVFALLVSRVFFGWSMLQCFTCALTGGAMELLFEIFFSPLGYRIARGIQDERGMAG